MVKKENSKKNKHLLPEDRREIEECLIISPDSSMCQPIRAILSTNNIRFEKIAEPIGDHAEGIVSQAISRSLPARSRGSTA
jgi:hypothetical protein